MSGGLMAALSTSIVNVALPNMSGALSASIEEITWVSTAYLLANVIVMPIIALLSAKFGRKRFYVFSMAIFTVFSIFCGIAWNLTSMIIFRIIQGFGGGTIIPLSQAILLETFPKEEQGTAMGIFGLGVIGGPAFGPTLGGWLVDNYSWSWIFYVNVPVGILCILLIMRLIEDPPYLVREKQKLDALGLFFMSVGLGALQVMLEKGEQWDWFGSGMIRGLAVAAFVGLALFAIRELTTDSPAVNLRIFRDINFSSGSFLAGIHNVGLYSSLFITPLLLQRLLDYPAYNSGLALMPRGLTMALAMPVGGWIYNRIGARLMVGFGFFVNAISFYALSRLSLDIGYWNIFFPQALQGIGFGFIFVALSTSTLSTVEKPLLTAASGLYNVTRQVFASVGIALAATFLTRGEMRYHAILVEHVTNYSDIVMSMIEQFGQRVFISGKGITGTGMEAIGLLEGVVAKQAAMLAYNHVFFLICILYLLSIPLVFLIKDEQRGILTRLLTYKNWRSIWMTLWKREQG
jgi:DHA2 family multidrug resistance protein